MSGEIHYPGEIGRIITLAIQKRQFGLRAAVTLLLPPVAAFSALDDQRIPQTHFCIIEVHSSDLRWLENGEGRPLTDCRLPMCRWVGGGLSRITRCGPSLFFQLTPGELLAQIGPTRLLAGGLRPLDGPQQPRKRD